MVVLAEYNNTMQAEMAKVMLESNGIEVSMRNEYMANTIPTGVMPVQLVVCESDFEQAKALLVAR